MCLASADQPVESGMVVSCLPDTGCSQTLISISLARQLQCKVKPDNSVRLFTADGNQMSVAGLADLSITNNNNNNLVEIKTHVFVFFGVPSALTLGT